MTGSDVPTPKRRKGPDIGRSGRRYAWRLLVEIAVVVALTVGVYRLTAPDIVTPVGFLLAAAIILALSELLRRSSRERERLATVTERFVGVQQASGIICWTLDPVDGSVDWMAEPSIVFPGAPKDMTLATWFAGIDDADKERVRRVVEEMFEKGEGGFSATYRFIGTRGESRYVTSVGLSADIRERSGQARRVFFGVGRDVTREVEAERQVRESEGRLRQLAERVRDAVWLYETKSDSLIYLSPACADMFGVDASPPLPLDRLFATVHPDDRGVVTEMRRRQRNGEETVCEFRRLAGETTRWLRVKTFPIESEAGEVYRAAGIATDVTTDIELREALRRAKEAAEAASAAKSNFLANMSHEIRTPLAAVLGFADILASGTASPEEAKSFAAKMRRNGNDLLRLVSDILDLSKVEAERLEVEKRRVATAEIVADVLEAFRPVAEAKGLALSSRVSGEVPAFIMTDEARLRQILRNIVGNAVRFTASGSVTLSVSYARAMGEIRFLVSDTGPGIGPDDRAKLFQPFSQVNAGYTRIHGGTGLGLALSKRLARLLGGDVTLERSAVGRGSDFLVTVSTELAERQSIVP